MTPDRNADRGGDQALTQDDPEHLARTGAQRDPDADLSRRWSRVGHDAVDAGDREGQRGSSKDRDQRQVEVPRAERGGIDLRERAETTAARPARPLAERRARQSWHRVWIGARSHHDVTEKRDAASG